ncbi:helix-turn-helix domain-containing protein [Roseococcus microcysteis]|uniref:helix-turn-helix domain-containing protein n=1 Tax=Roseococcus microcysteis TaxID=2771361 RepID=UPI00168A8897|nr:helix-turn-helix transcriptional regulator [Roseococcus microcysteis]
MSTTRTPTPALTMLGQDAAREWVLRLAHDKQQELSNLARRAGIATSTLTRAMNPAQNGKLTQATLEKLSRAYGVEIPKHVLDSVEPGRRRYSAAPMITGLGQLPPAPSGPNDVPIWGAVQTHRPGFFHVNHAALDHAKRPPGGAAIARLACIRMPDESMEPWRMAGEAIYLDPNRPIALMNHALVECIDPARPNDPSLAFIAQRRREGWYLHGPRAFLDLGALQIMDRYRILEWAELLG